MNDNLVSVFERHPPPWEIEYDAATGENGGTIHFINDANKEVVISTYGNYGTFRTMWEMYSFLFESGLVPEKIHPVIKNDFED